MKENQHKLFKVAAVSSNTNDFGLYAVILIGADGEAWRVAANNLNVKKAGEILTVALAGPRHRRVWETFGFEIPMRLPEAPLQVVREVWK